MNTMVTTSVRRIIKILNGRKGYNYLGESPGSQEAMIDLLADICHFAREKGFDFNEAVQRSKFVSKEERSVWLARCFL
jgi:hypothetical protein